MSLTTQFAKWLRSQLAPLDELEADPRDTLESCNDLADVISEAGRRAAAAGLPDAVKACQIRSGPVGTDLARRVLSTCLAAYQATNQKARVKVLDDGPLTVEQAAAELGVSNSTVYRLCDDGVLSHARIGTRITITPQQLEQYRREAER
jgi:excisionase family DNA binding protein